MIEVLTDHLLIPWYWKKWRWFVTVIEEQESVQYQLKKTQVKAKDIQKTEFTTLVLAEEAAKKQKAFLQDVLKKMEIGKFY